jgi:hypothetical protein
MVGAMMVGALARQAPAAPAMAPPQLAHAPVLGLAAAVRRGSLRCD